MSVLIHSSTHFQALKISGFPVQLSLPLPVGWCDGQSVTVWSMWPLEIHCLSLSLIFFIITNEQTDTCVCVCVCKGTCWTRLCATFSPFRIALCLLCLFCVTHQELSVAYFVVFNLYFLLSNIFKIFFHTFYFIHSDLFKERGYACLSKQI